MARGLIAKDRAALAEGPPLRADSARTEGSAWWQAALILAVWILVVGLHWENDGLWFQGDSSRHAANGLFWRTYLSAPTLDVKDYALSYYARYPVINPIAYPPFFYILEAAAYSVLGPSALVAKNLVLAFALMAAVYVSAWLRRWVSPGVGWAAALLLLMPGVLRWSHAVMLNIPALALSIASLYHGRRWFHSTDFSLRSVHLYLSMILCALAILTYYPAGVVVFVLIALFLAEGTWRRFSRWQVLLPALAGALLLVPSYLLLARWNPAQLRRVVIGSARRMWDPDSWLYYGEYLPTLFGWTALGLAIVGLTVGLWSRRWRREAVLVSAWLVVTYGVFSILAFKDKRYILSLGPPLVCASSIGFAWMADKLSLVAPRKRLTFRMVGVLGVFVVLGIHIVVASGTPVPSISGFGEVTAFLRAVAPDEPVFYDGPAYNGVFTFHVQAADPDFRRRVVLGNKLLYAYSMHPGSRQMEYVSSAQDVVDILRTEGGCRWLAIERGERSESTPGMRYLRQAIQGPEFELVQSFPIASKHVQRVDVYRMSGPIRRPKKVRLPFPYVSKATVFEVEPIPTRTPRGIQTGSDLEQ